MSVLTGCRGKIGISPATSALLFLFTIIILYDYVININYDEDHLYILQISSCATCPSVINLFFFDHAFNFNYIHY